MTLHANRKILVIDDEPSMHTDYRRVLTASEAANASTACDSIEESIFGERAARPPQDFNVVFAHQGQEGVELSSAAGADGLPFAVAFVDMRMPPGWDGLRTVQELWALDPRVQVVICTAHADYTWDTALATLDAPDRLLIVKKPFDPVEIWQAASLLSAKWNLEREVESKLAALEQRLGECSAALSATNGSICRRS